MNLLLTNQLDSKVEWEVLELNEKVKAFIL